MSIKKQFLKSKPECKVTFALDKKTVGDAKKVTIVGEFNNWNEKNTSMTKLKNGSFKANLNLPVNQEYQFRYLVDGKNWVNDEAADKYIKSNLSSDDNSVISL